MSKKSFGYRLGQDLKKHSLIYIMAIPMIVYYVLFHYIPIYGAVIAFKKYSPALGIAKLNARDIMGYCLVDLILTGVIICVGFILVGVLGISAL